MADYFSMTKAELSDENARLEAAYRKFKDMNLDLNMARGKPGPHQMDLAMELLHTEDYTANDGTDARNYGNLEGLYEARSLFGDVMGVKPEEVFVGGNSSLQLMYNLVAIGYMFGFPESLRQLYRVLVCRFRIFSRIVMVFPVFSRRFGQPGIN